MYKINNKKLVLETMVEMTNYITYIKGHALAASGC